MLRRDVAVWGARRVMWRQADNPLAPSDKYEVRRTFPVARLHSVSLAARRRKRDFAPTMQTGWRSPAEKSLSHQIMAATDRPFHSPYADTQIFFFLSQIFPDICISLARVARCVQKLRTIPLPTKLVKLQPARLFWKWGMDGGTPLLLLFISSIFLTRCMLSCQTQIQISVTLKLNKFATKRNAPSAKRNGIFRALSHW